MFSAQFHRQSATELGREIQELRRRLTTCVRLQHMHLQLAGLPVAPAATESGPAELPDADEPEVVRPESKAKLPARRPFVERPEGVGICRRSTLVICKALAKLGSADLEQLSQAVAAAGGYRRRPKKCLSRIRTTVGRRKDLFQRSGSQLSLTAEGKALVQADLAAKLSSV